jgi:hypothetical protein
MNKEARKMYRLVSDTVESSAPPHKSWHRLVNQLRVEECLAVMICAKDGHTHGTPKRRYEDALSAATNAHCTAGGRILMRDDGLNEADQEACAIYNRAANLADERNETILGVMRMCLALRSFGVNNGPYDTYIRIALCILRGY